MSWPEGLKHTAQAKERIRQARLRRKARDGYLNSPETREKIRQAKLGKKASPETRAKMSRIALERGTAWWMGRKLSPEHREKIRQSLLGGKMPPRTVESRERYRQSRLRQTFPSKMTSLERSLLEQFRKRRLKFEMHRTMFKRFQPDFVFEDARLIVQADGDYWHRQLKPKRDARFNDAAHAGGWTVWRFAESEIQMHPEVCGKAVARFVRAHQSTLRHPTE